MFTMQFYVDLVEKPVLEISFHDVESSEKIASVNLLIQKVQEIQQYVVLQDKLGKCVIFSDTN